MKSTGILREEHKTMKLVLLAADLEVAAIRKKGRLNRTKLYGILDFFTTYVGRAHHSKEEEFLFTKIRERGTEDMSIPIAVMLHEHAAGRAKIHNILETLPVAGENEPATAALADCLADYTHFLLNHVIKEDEVLFPLADRLLTPLIN